MKPDKHQRSRKIFFTDFILLLLFLPLFIGGLFLHFAGHGDNHECWHTLALIHVIIALLFLICTGWHILHHWNWYKTLSKGLGKKSRITPIVTILFIIETLTGIYLLIWGEGANSDIGLLHYQLGIVWAMFACGHTIKRFKILKRGLAR